MGMGHSSVFEIYTACALAMAQGALIQRVSSTDKEFHFQNWFADRLEGAGVRFDKGGRNSYPDFTLVNYTEGYEVKGLAWPGRDQSYDCNSQVPTGYHNGRQVHYVFGRYPAAGSNQREYPVVDLVICHGSFLNADHGYVHRNRSVKGFGSYGDIMIRDRKMYVAPTPFAIAEGLTGVSTLIVPWDWFAPPGLKKVGEIVRRETAELVVGYEFDLRTNEIAVSYVANPDADREHRFAAYRLLSGSDNMVIACSGTAGRSSGGQGDG